MFCRVDPSGTAQDSKKKDAAMNLRCAFCGATFSPLTEITGGRGYMAWPELVGYRCNDDKCGAEWNQYGNVTKESSLT